MLDRLAFAGIDPALITPVMGVEESYLDAAYAAATERFGSMRGYFTAGLGLDHSTLDAVRTRLVV